MRTATLLLLALLCAVAGCGGEKSASDGETADAPEAAPSVAAQSRVAGCRAVDTPRPRADGGERPPRKTLDPSVSYHVVMRTSCGPFTIKLDPEASPKAVSSFARLVKRGFFDGTLFHRILPGFVIQGGDPTGGGNGDPGYTTRDEVAPDTSYTRGVVAMAKSDTDPAGSGGSQFYIVTAADAALPPQYAVIGKVTEGLEVTERIEQLGDPGSGGSGTPLQAVVIERARLKVGG